MRIQSKGQGREWRWARRLLAALMAVAGVAGWTAVLGQAPTQGQPRSELRVVFIAYENPDQLLEDVRPVVAYLERKLGRKVRAFVASDYAGVVEALRNQTADVGFMGPLQYLIAHEQAGAQAILGEVYNGQPWYTARIFVRKDSGMRTLADLRGKTMAFVDPLSSSGYLYPLETFRRAGLIARREEAEQFFRKIYFAGGDEQALRAVLNKFVDAAGIGQYSSAILRPEERDQITFIGESPQIPSHCVVARRGLDAASVAALQEALLALNDGPDRALLKQLYNVDGYVRVTHQTFAETEQLAREYGFLKGDRR
jgi:phosphonate transport system substrate-binding protein